MRCFLSFLASSRKTYAENSYIKLACGGFINTITFDDVADIYTVNCGLVMGEDKNGKMLYSYITAYCSHRLCSTIPAVYGSQGIENDKAKHLLSGLFLGLSFIKVNIDSTNYSMFATLDEISISPNL